MFGSPPPLSRAYDDKENVDSTASPVFRQTQPRLPSSIQLQDEDGLDSDNSKEAQCTFS